MALRDAWWMNTRSAGQLHTASPASQRGLPHLSWPRTHVSNGLSFGILEQTLRDNVGSSCLVARYDYTLPSSTGNTLPASGRTCPRWTHYKTVTTVDALLDLLKESVAPGLHSIIYVASILQGEAIQALGYHLEITPRFFNFPYTRVSTGNTVERYAFFSLQLMDKYQLGRKPSEAGRSDTSPTYRFRNAGGDYHPHEWHVTCVRLIYLKDKNNVHFRGLLLVDPLDDVIADGLKILMTRDEEQPPGEAELHAGLGQVLSETIYIVTYNWTAFFKEAETHLQVLSKICVDKDLTGDEQLRYTRELHQLSPLWVQVRRRLIAARDLVHHMIGHPFFSIIGGFNGRIAIDSYLSKQIKTIDDQITKV